MKKTCAWTSPLALSRIGISPARAVYRRVRPETTTWWRVTTMLSGGVGSNAGACDHAAAGQAATTTESAMRSATFK